MLRVIAHREWRGDIVTAETTEGAISVIDGQTIDAAFVDYYIPTKLGTAIIKHLKHKNPAAHIALVTSSPSEHVAKDGRDAGAEAVVCSSHQSDVVEKQLVDLLQQWQ